MHGARALQAHKNRVQFTWILAVFHAGSLCSEAKESMDGEQEEDEKKAEALRTSMPRSRMLQSDVGTKDRSVILET